MFLAVYFIAVPEGPNQDSVFFIFERTVYFYIVVGYGAIFDCVVSIISLYHFIYPIVKLVKLRKENELNELREKNRTSYQLGETDLDINIWFWEVYGERDVGDMSIRMMCSCFYVCGYLLISVVAIENLYWVVCQVSAEGLCQ